MENSPDEYRELSELAAQLRVDSIRCTTAAGSGHPTSSMSAADLMAVLLKKYFRYNFSRPELQNNDHLIFSKGHACPLLYSMFKAAGAISNNELMLLRKFGSRLEGHPNPRVTPYTDLATGSLGQGLAAGVGIGLAGKYLDKLPYRIWVLLGDSEMAEGSNWEAFDKAWYYKLNNLIAILDMNRLGQRGETEIGWNSAIYASRVRAFGWNTIEIDGHDISAIDDAFARACASSDLPTCIIARTEKGHGVSFTANKEGWHGKALNAEQEKLALKELGGERNIIVSVAHPESLDPAPLPPPHPAKFPEYKTGGKESTRRAYGDALVTLGAINPKTVVLDGEVSNSTYSEEFKKAYPDRFFEMFIAEQQMISAAAGLSVSGLTVFASTFAAFLTRAYDQIRMTAVAGISIRLCGSHAGVSIGEDGPSQMGLEDIAMFRAVNEGTVLYPCDPNQTTQLVKQMMTLGGISYLRTTREKTPVIYAPGVEFPVGGSRTLRETSDDAVTVIAAGITVHESLEAYEILQRSKIFIRVIDAYSVKPIDIVTIHRAARETRKLIIVEDHWFEGGLGDAVLNVFLGLGQERPDILKLAVRHMPGSGSPANLLHAAGIDAQAIVAAVKSML